ncbi:MAG: glutaredoxin family protein [Gammaproteobacteria bacterium]|nr:glutaredoxin family protein [Gammaproteobacteria bacterium]
MKNIKLVLTSLCLVFLIASTQGYAQLYKWVDADGRVHYGDNPPEHAKLEQITGKVSSYSSVSVEPNAFDATTQSNGAKTVVMYSTSWCGYCKKAARHFRKNSIPFTEHDIELSVKAAREYKKLNGRGVPVILIGEQRMNGFSAETFDKIYYEKS